VVQASYLSREFLVPLPKNLIVIPNESRYAAPDVVAQSLSQRLRGALSET
jgi:hypothetical protein